MDAILVFDANNYLVFAHYNKQFLDEISALAFEHKMIDANSRKKLKKILQTNFEELQSVIVLLFAPYVASIRVLRGKCPHFEIPSERPKNVQTVFTEHLEYIFLYISDSNNFLDLKCMQRRIEMFLEIVKFVFGVSVCEMKSDQQQTQLVIAMFHNWIDNKTLPAFILEATERLMVSATLQATFCELLEDVLNKTRLCYRSDEIATHAFLFVDNKLLSNVSSRNTEKISEPDIFMLILLVNTLLTTKTDTECIKRMISTTTEEEYDGDYDSGDYSSPKKGFKADSMNNITIETSFTEPTYRFKEVEHFLVFLRSQNDKRFQVPYNLKFLKISESMCIIVLSELATSGLAFHIQNLLSILNSLQYKPNELRCFHTLHEYDNSVNKLKSYFMHRKQISNCGRNLLSKFEQLAKSDVKKFIVSFGEEELPSQLDAICSSACNTLREMYDAMVYRFQRAILNEFASNKDLNHDTNQIRRFCIVRLKDYLDYLLVKSKRNMTVETYSDIIPGLVSFIYVDRTHNEFIYAIDDDLNEAIGDSNITTMNFSENILPKMIEIAYNSLICGKIVSKWTENGLCFNYFMWFEDASGHTAKVQNKEFKLSSFPSIVRNNFVEQIMNRCFPCRRLKQVNSANHGIYCYEIFYIQKASDAKNCDYLKQGKRLAAKLWELSSCSSERIMSLN